MVFFINCTSILLFLEGLARPPLFPGPKGFSNQVTVVDTDGVVHLGVKNDDSNSFYNVPYAAPPVGDLRFRPPKALTPQTNTPQNNTVRGNRCMQAVSPTTTQDGTSEDCLYLNIFAPKKGNRLPVIVYVHGGNFNQGSGNEQLFDSSTLVNKKEGAIIVTINYRLGVFGFLASKELAAEGPVNAGLLDQEAAFLWVQKNIAAFGGDPTQVTAMGQSAGSISLGAHLLTNGGNQRLFSRAVLLSGGPLMLYQVPQTFQPVFDQIASSVNCTPNTSDVLACLRNVDAKLLNEKGSFATYAPVADGKYVPTQAFDSLLVRKQFSKVPLYVHTNLNEGSIFPRFSGVQNKQQAEMFKRGTAPFFGDAQFQVVDQLYPADGDVQAIDAAGDFFADLVFQCSVKMLSEVYTAAGVNVYRTEFAHVPLVNVFASKLPNANLGVYHGAELQFFFQGLNLIDPSERQLSDKMQSAIYKFARKGVPAEKWQPYGQAANVFDIESKTTKADVQRKQQCDFLVGGVSNFLTAFSAALAQ